MPRSPSRDRSDRFIGQPRRYFRSWNPIEKWKFWLSGLAVLLLVGWGIASFTSSSRRDFQTSHGPLANPHAAWDSQCDACHDKGGEGKGVFNWLDAHQKWNSFTCEKCHAAPVHHASIPAGDAVENCASCHHDHKGKDNSLVRMTDAHCVRCHSQLASTKFETKISRFNVDHPEFKSIQTRPSTIKFSHARHLTAGIVLAEGAKGSFTLDKIPADLREKYRQAGQLDTAAVQLDCKSCHSLDASPRADGKYFAPISFEQSCIACHATETGPVLKQAREVVPSSMVPHGKSFDELQEFAKLLYSSKLQAEHKSLFSSPNPFETKKKDDPAVLAYQDDVKQATDKALGFLTLQCRKCHELEGNRVKPTAIPAVWMTHAKFDHASHRGADCKSCHPNAVARFVGNDPDYEREKVNILGIDSCKQCHAPESFFGKATPGDINHGGVRHGCTDCHRFHGGDQPLHGRGSAIWAPKQTQSIGDLLKGDAGSKSGK
ncbi:MAG: cytochrome c3 family protein [Gemmataceae bacterium]